MNVTGRKVQAKYRSLILFWEATYVCVCAYTYYKKIKRKSIA